MDEPSREYLIYVRWQISPFNATSRVPLAS